jgi:hypothetical protein
MTDTDEQKTISKIAAGEPTGGLPKAAPTYQPLGGHEPSGPFLDPRDYEYVLAVPKPLAMVMVPPGRGDNPAMGKAREELAPSDWQPGVKFYINGVLKNFKGLEISIDDEMELDKKGHVLPKFPKVKIHG